MILEAMGNNAFAQIIIYQYSRINKDKDNIDKDREKDSVSRSPSSRGLAGHKTICIGPGMLGIQTIS